MEQFVWNSHSVVTGPNGPVSRPDPISQANVVLIPAQTATACLTLAAAAFLGQSEFCISGPTPHKDLIRETLSESGAAGFFQCLSSGSSGRPKRMRRSHASWTKSFRINAGLWGITRQDSYAVLGALSHSLALYSCLEGLYLGADLLLLSDLRPDRQAIQIEKKDASILYATPTQLRQLHTYAARPLPSLRKVIIGGASLDPATRNLAERLCPNAEILEFYGAAETSFISLSDSQTPAGSVGRAYPDVEISVRGFDGAPLARNMQGELWVRSPYLFAGYCDNSAPAASHTPEWISVGEVGQIDQAGFLFLTGRRSRMFTVADQNIFPEQIESWFQARGVDPVAVLQQRDPQLGNKAVLVTTGQHYSTDQLKALSRDLPMHAKPRSFITVDSWPRLASGKTDLQALAAQLGTTT